MKVWEGGCYEGAPCHDHTGTLEQEDWPTSITKGVVIAVAESTTW